MDQDRARELLRTERARVQGLLGDTARAAREDRDAANQPGDMTDPSEPLTDEEIDDAVVAGLQDRLAAVERAEQRIGEGTFGYSILSGEPIPDERLEADPTAELTEEESQRARG
jgi:DnaK suppressor protein